jgi:hypothetical protein
MREYPWRSPFWGDWLLYVGMGLCCVFVFAMSVCAIIVIMFWLVV